MDIQTLSDKSVVTIHLADDGIFPNNQLLPVILYRQVLDLPLLRPAAAVERLFEGNDYSNFWRGTVYDFHHYHSNTHEVMGIFRGSTDLMLGGENGVRITVRTGDVLLIPAGVAHKNLSPESSFRLVGAYPGGMDFDMNSGKPGERPEADRNIHRVALPQYDPVYGDRGPMIKHWLKKVR